jgi:UDP-N-acetylmuramoyl-tripeptide--D-alanyl-D-alanine ligase
MPEDTEILILEFGTNRAGEIKSLVSRYPVTHAIITDVAAAHLEGFGDIGGVLRAKMEIAESRGLQYLSYNSDNETLAGAVADMREGEKLRKGGIKQIGVGFSNSCVRLSEVRQTLDGEFDPSLSFVLSRGETKITCSAPIFGRQHAKNAAFAYAAAVQMDLPDDEFPGAASSFRLPEGRGSISRRENGVVVIDDTYNANPSSVSAALKNLLEMETESDLKRVAILGGMRELGEESAHWHEVVLSRACLLDAVWLIGEEWGGAAERGGAVKGVWKTTESFIAGFDFSGLTGCAALIKGSRYYALERILPLMEEKP